MGDNPSKHKLFLLPTWFGGLDIVDPTKSSSRSSVHAAAAFLTASIKEGSTFDLNSLMNTVLMARHQDAFSGDAWYEQKFASLLSDFDAFCKHAILRAKDQTISAWLSALPLVKNQNLICLPMNSGMV